MERRYTAPGTSGLRLEKREDGARVLAAYAAVFYRADDPTTEYRIWDDMVERIMPTAFNAAVAEGDDARALWNHGTDNLLGRRGSGTLGLSVDDRGLLYEIQLPDTSVGRDLQALAERGDVPGSSFGFLCGYGAKRGRVVWVQENRDGKLVDVREVHDLELFEVSPCTFPAYEGTGSPTLRSAGDAAELLRRERDAWRSAIGAEITAEELDLAATVAEVETRGWR